MLLINDNNKIDQLHIGCDNLLDQAQIMNNGESNANQSRFFQRGNVGNQKFEQVSSSFQIAS